jgi:hypothetical protein
MRLLCAVAIGLMSIAVGATPAHAQDATAEVLFQDGDRLMRDGKLLEACDAFEASNRVEPRAGTLLRLGDCREKRSQFASAWSAYHDAAERAKDPAKKAAADAKVKALESRLSRLTIAPTSPVPAMTISRGGVAVDTAVWGRSIPLDGGEVTIKASAPGFASWEKTITVGNEGDAVTVEVPRLLDNPTTIAPKNPIVDPGLITRVKAPNQEPSAGLSGRQKLAIGLAAGGVVAVGAGMVIGLSATSLEDDAHRACPMVRCVMADDANDKLDRARTRATLANLSYGIGGTAIAAGVVLWFTGHAASGERRVTVLPRINSSMAGATVDVRF